MTGHAPGRIDGYSICLPSWDTWVELGQGAHRRPCTSPRRNQCRRGGFQRLALSVAWTEYPGEQDCCEQLPW